MVRGIAIFGLNGSGKSTLTHILAKQIDYFEMDVEDYYFPEQRESRKKALENNVFGNMEYLDVLPFSNPRAKIEVQNAIMKDIKIHPKFIIASVTMNWSVEILSHIDIAFFIQTPLDERLRRIQSREEKRFGARVLAGGDMFAQQIEFRKAVKDRDLKDVEECVMKFACPVVTIDGTLPVADNLKKIIRNLNLISEAKFKL